MLTAISSKEVKETVRRLGGHHYLTKPWKLGGLLAEIGAALGMGDGEPSLA